MLRISVGTCGLREELSEAVEEKLPSVFVCKMKKLWQGVGRSVRPCSQARGRVDEIPSNGPYLGVIAVDILICLRSLSRIGILLVVRENFRFEQRGIRVNGFVKVSWASCMQLDRILIQLQGFLNLYRMLSAFGPSRTRTQYHRQRFSHLELSRVVDLVIALVVWDDVQGRESCLSHSH